LLAALGLVAGLVLVPTAANADTSSPSPDPSGGYCASQITADAPMSDPVCFDTQDELDGYLASQGVIEPQNGALKSNAVQAASADVILGTVYKNANLKGDSLTLFGNGSRCDGVTYGFSSLASGWNNSISSAVAVTGCWMTLYSKTSYAGDKITCTPECDTVSSLLNDKVKSILFKPTGEFG